MRDITRELAASTVDKTNEAIAAFDEMAPDGASPYRFPALRDHQQMGDTFGTIEQAKFGSIDGKTGAWFRVRWTDEARAIIAAQTLRYVSLHIDEYTVQDGRTFSPVAVDLSLTAYPRIQSIGTVQDTLGLRLSALAGTQLATPTNGAVMDPETAAAIVAALEILATRMEALEATVAALATGQTPAAEDVAEVVAAAEAGAPEVPEPDEALAASNLAILTQLKALNDRMGKFEKLNLSRVSSAAAFSMPTAPRSIDDIVKDKSLSTTVRLAALDAHIARTNGKT